MTKQKHTCPECAKTMRQSAGLLCDKCVRDEGTRKRYGVLTAADFSLDGLDLTERMLLFLFATGRSDVLEYYDAMPALQRLPKTGRAGRVLPHNNERG